MKKIKPLSKKHRLQRWLRQLLGIKKDRPRMSDLLANIDEMHTVPTNRPPIVFKCPCCGTHTLMEPPKPRPDGRTIAQIIIDEVPPTYIPKKAVKFLKEISPGYPEYTYNLAAINLEAMKQSAEYDAFIEEVAKRINDRAETHSSNEMNIKAVDKEEHQEIHQSDKS